MTAVTVALELTAATAAALLLARWWWCSLKHHRRYAAHVDRTTAWRGERIGEPVETWRMFRRDGYAAAIRIAIARDGFDAVAAVLLDEQHPRQITRAYRRLRRDLEAVA